MLEDLVVWYLFIGGAGAGLLFSAAVLESLSPHAVDRTRAARSNRYVPKEAYARFFGPAYGVGIAAVALGMLCLLLDLGRSDRALALFLQPTPSFITVGAFALVILMLIAAVLFAVWMLGALSLPKAAACAVRVCCMVAAAVVMVYTGLFLSSMSSVPLWASPWLPVLFVASALSAGLALLVCVIVLTGSGDEFTTTLRRIQKADAVIIVCELAVLALFVASAVFGGDTARLSAERLIQGDLASVFWGCVVVLGLAAPLVLEAVNRAMNPYAVIATGGLVLAGGYFLRWCVAEAGMAPDIVASVMGVLGIQ
ncbi:NrfD/PsrC family molybdoenzyme membrane anchor subunit [Raoultibacter phocaeensis]|uniref:NrfD/PsrC family molybdoenzyme membrane anchor subunit n=1 Tax=Raoultibacter phocaeensis TaxID=2479841 RepID=UPI001119C142|nr:NrfD/PsrC family molybdoenzyme membrane anchor subunit [Raoultibacter phocaeensis]